MHGSIRIGQCAPGGNTLAHGEQHGGEHVADAEQPPGFADGLHGFFPEQSCQSRGNDADENASEKSGAPSESRGDFASKCHADGDESGGMQQHIEGQFEFLR